MAKTEEEDSAKDEEKRSKTSARHRHRSKKKERTDEAGGDSRRSASRQLISIKNNCLQVLCKLMTLRRVVWSNHGRMLFPEKKRDRLTQKRMKARKIRTLRIPFIMKCRNRARNQIPVMLRQVRRMTMRENSRKKKVQTSSTQTSNDMDTRRAAI